MLKICTIKRSATVALICGAFLPLSECSQHGDKDVRPESKPFAQRIFPQNDADFMYQYAFTRISLSLFGGLTALAFTWPAIVVLLTRRSRPGRFRWILNVLELLLCCGTLYWLEALRFNGRALYGYYVVQFAIVIYGLAVIVSLIRRTKDHFALVPAAALPDQP